MMKELLGYGLALAAIVFILIIAAEQGGVIGTDISERMVRFMPKASDYGNE